MNHRIFERKLRSRGLTPREHVRLSAASIYPFNKSHSTHTHTPCGGGIGGTGFTTAAGGGMASDCVYGEIVPQHTHTDNIHILSCVCEALMCCCCRCRSVGWLCVCVLCVWGCVVHTPGIAVCAAAALLAAAPLHREARAARHARSIQLCRVCAWTRSHISGVCVCVSHTHTHPRHHQPSPTPAHASAYEHGTVYAPLLLQHSFMIVVIILYIPASSRATVPAEFKHINKRRKRNQQGFP